MPDHWHALLWPGFPLTISRVVQDVKWISARSLNRGRRASRPVWQHQFWDRFVRHAQEFRERLDYMHLNPVRKGLVKRPDDWTWSSYNNFALDKERIERCPLRIDYVHLPESYRGRPKAHGTKFVPWLPARFAVEQALSFLPIPPERPFELAGPFRFGSRCELM